MGFLFAYSLRNMQIGISCRVGALCMKVIKEHQLQELGLSMLAYAYI